MIRFLLDLSRFSNICKYCLLRLENGVRTQTQEDLLSKIRPEAQWLTTSKAAQKQAFLQDAI